LKMSEVIPEFEKPLLKLEKRIKDLELAPQKNAKKIAKLKQKLLKLRKKIFSKLSPYQRVQLARHPLRPLFSDYLKSLFSDFVELHGDRLFADDPAIISGIAKFGKKSVAVIGQEKGKTTAEKMRRNFGMPHPEGYRKALRIMKLAEKFNLPILTFVDTPGAYPGIGAEERGQSRAIAHNLMEMSGLRVPVITTVIGEGGSGGALAIAVANYVLMLENSIYSVISPEGCASILFRDASLAPRAAEVLKLTAEDLFRFGVIDEIVPEPLGGAHLAPEKQAQTLKEKLSTALCKIQKISDCAKHRYEKFRKIGVYA